MGEQEQIQDKEGAMPTARATRASHRAPTGLGHSAGIAIASKPLDAETREALLWLLGGAK